MPNCDVTAMLDCEDGEKDRDANCKHCQATGDNPQRYWDIQLDQDLLETIVSIYPEWFKDCNMNLASADAQDSAENAANLFCADAKGAVKEESLQRTIDKNKESLKLKLMLRRPLNQLVDQGILPSLKSPPSFHEQRQKLERAKMGDILKHKLQKRPGKQELIQQHVLEDSSADPSLQEKQKQLKKARLTDALNGMISQRPAPLELVKGNILCADELLAQAVRERSLPFKTTYDTPSPPLRPTFDEDSGSDGAFSPSPPYDFSEHSQSSLPSLEASEPSPHLGGSPCSGVTSFSMSPPSSVSSPMSGTVFPSVVSPQSDPLAEYLVHHMHQHHLSSSTLGKEHHHQQNSASSKNRKKSKPKTQPKARTIKFHEYRGPPNAQKSSTSTPSALSEAHSELWLQQQQLFLRLQQECLQNHTQLQHNGTSPQTAVVQKPTGDQIVQTFQKSTPTSHNAQPQIFEAPSSPQKLLSNFEDLKVSDLKAELKKKGLPVSGSKPQLIKRLRSHVPSGSSSSPTVPPHSTLTVDNLLLDGLPSGETPSMEIPGAALKGLVPSLEEDGLQTSSVCMELEPGTGLELGDLSESSSTSLSNEHIVQLQQIWIEKLQRDLERSRKQLEQCQMPVAPPPATALSSGNKQPSSTPPPKSNPPSSNTFKNGEAVQQSAESKAAQRQIIHQILQQKIQQQELQKAQRLQGNLNTSQSNNSSTNANSTLTALLKSSPLNAAPLDLDLNSVAKVNRDLNSMAKVQIHRDLDLNSMSKVQVHRDLDLNSMAKVNLDLNLNSMAKVNLDLDLNTIRKVNMDLNSMTKANLNLTATTESVAAFPGTMGPPLQLQEAKNEVLSEEDYPTMNLRIDAPSEVEEDFPGVVPILLCHAPGEEMSSKRAILNPPNTLNHRSSSLPSFSALKPSKPSPTRSNTDPQFHLGRPPPNYTEATKQLKIKQHHLTVDDGDGNPRQSKKHKASVKSQAVDDVLEILISNGELSPSAAQEPTTPITPVTCPAPGDPSSLGLFPASSSEPFFSAPLSSNPKEVLGSGDLHLAASLQSLMDLTPPSSTGYADQGGAPSSSLDFDFPLDMTDITAMELDGLDGAQGATGLEASLSMPPARVSKPTQSLDFSLGKTEELGNPFLKSPSIVEAHDRRNDRGLDSDILIEWLGDFDDAAVHSTTSSHFGASSTSYDLVHDGDPLFSDGHDALDFFSGDDMDFKPQHDLNFLPWGENAT